MSSEPEENPIHIDSVDVVLSSKENVSVAELTSDSGLETLNSISGACPTSSHSALSSDNVLELDEKVSLIVGIENERDSALSSPISISTDSNDLTDNILCDNEYSLTKDDSTDEKEYDSPAKDPKSNVFQTVPESKVCLGSKNEVEVSTTNINYDYKAADLNSVNSRALTTSTVSLNEPNISEAISKSGFSRSAENISSMEQSNEPNKNSNKELDTDQILSEFTNQKNKMTATQKIPDQTQANNDVRYARLPKELLPQDLGSIVKNVHGIFSTVSGSLKNAYNNSHRISMQKVPVKQVIKPIPNGKVMNDIFEDEIVEEKPQANGIEKSTESLECPSINSDAKSDQESVESDSDSKKEVQKLQIETLEKLLADQRKENAVLRERMKQHLDELQEKDHSFKDLEAKLDLMGKRVEQAEREKDAAVMRYASVECAGIEARRSAERAAAGERRALQEAELLAGKVKTAHQEKQRICQLYDDKCHELSNSEREVAKVREEVRELEGRLKWTQSKLRMEMDAYKDSAERVEKLTQQVTELEAAKEAAVTNASDSAKAKQLELELKESQAALILCRHERDELERRLTTANQQLDICTRERDAATAHLTRTTHEVEDLKIRNLQLEEEAAELAALRAQAALADTLGAQLQRESARASLAEAQRAEAAARAETCARREAAALDHAARLTALHVQHSHAARAHHDKVEALTADNSSLRERIETLEEECSKLQSALSEETDRRNKENKVLARKVAELTEEVSEANKKLEWEKGENGVLKKKHSSAIKELNRELQRSLKRCEQLEAKLPPPDAPSTRTGSISSLSSGESAAVEERLQNGHESTTVPDIQVKSPDRQALIERIVSLQRAAARRAERAEFLEEHAKQLTGELRAKSKLLRHLLSTLPAGAVASQHRDANKKEIARLGGGAMAAVWGGDPGGLSPELALQMTARLQAVLEDTLLKNITLKENMDTLGAEISRLKEQAASKADAK